MTERANVSVFPVEDKKKIQHAITASGLPLTIDESPVDIHGEPIKFAFRVWAHCDTRELWPFWREFYHLFPERKPQVRLSR